MTKEELNAYKSAWARRKRSFPPEDLVIINLYRSLTTQTLLEGKKLEKARAVRSRFNYQQKLLFQALGLLIGKKLNPFRNNKKCYHKFNGQDNSSD